jgi:hypothetical protein
MKALKEKQKLLKPFILFPNINKWHMSKPGMFYEMYQDEFEKVEFFRNNKPF